MNVASLNIRGINCDLKIEWVRKICLENKINFIGIQETMSNNINHNTIRLLWGNDDYNFLVKNPIDKSGGIVAIWDGNLFTIR